MPSVTFSDSVVELQNQETVLDGLLRTGHDIPNGCKAGACQSCLLIAEDTNLPATATSGLSESQKQLGVFKSCCLIPAEDIFVKSADDLIQRDTVALLEKDMLNDSVIRLRFETAMGYFSGQYLTLWKDNTVARSYSIASTPDEPYLEFHLRHYPEGQFSHWAYTDLKVGDQIQIQGPMGNCFYTRPENETDLLLCASGTGFAPLYGILREALQQKHRGKIQLLFAGRNYEDLYYLEELQQLAEAYDSFSYQLITLEEGVGQAVQADIYEYVKNEFSNLKGNRIYICGAESFVKKLKKQCFLAGANMQDIFTDSFVSFQPGS